jgi:hypothetical protein
MSSPIEIYKQPRKIGNSTYFPVPKEISTLLNKDTIYRIIIQEI